MDFNNYQFQANMTALYREKSIGSVIYPALEIAGEAGEVADKVKKLIRDGNGVENIPDNIRHDIALELGDVLWGIAAMCTDLGYNLDQIAQMNLDKLSARRNAGTLTGSGDHR